MKHRIENKEENAKKGAPRFRMEMDSSQFGMSMLVCGVRRIEEYTEERIALKIIGGGMILSGVALRLCVFENKTVEVRGKVQEVRFSYDRN